MKFRSKMCTFTSAEGDEDGSEARLVANVAVGARRDIFDEVGGHKSRGITHECATEVGGGVAVRYFAVPQTGVAILVVVGGASADVGGEHEEQHSKAGDEEQGEGLHFQETGGEAVREDAGEGDEPGRIGRRPRRGGCGAGRSRG
jgi:hypothetical protein